MESRRLTSTLVTVFAALAVFYPMTSAIRGSGKGSAPVTASKTEVESQQAETASAAFPTAEDLVSEFLFTEKGKQGAPVGPTPGTAYTIDFLIVTTPDPVSSRLPHFFDSFVESVQSAAEASGYTIDRSAFPWIEKRSGAGDRLPSSRQSASESAPGLMLFRDPPNRRLLLVFLVGETPTEGIQKQAMFSALEQMAQFYPWHPKHADLPPGFPQVTPGLNPAPESPPGVGSESGPTFRIMGPAFSGSAASLRFVLDKWNASRSDYPRVHFQIISGTATAIDAAWISQSAQGHATFQATVPPDNETLQAIACYINRLGYQKIAILTEGNTAYGQSFTNRSAGGKASGKLAECASGQNVPEILTLPFPMHISRLRVATSKAQQQAAAAPAAVSDNPPSGSPAEPSASGSAEIFPTFSDLTVQSTQLTLSNLLAAIAREQYSYVGIVATDVRDVTFLAQEVRAHAPATILFTLNSDLLYAYPDVNSATRGMIVITPYPLFNLEQLWTYAYGGGKSRLQFSNQAAEGVYNATLALLGQDGKLVDYGRPVAVSENPTPTEPRKPSLWVTAIGNAENLPVRLLEWNDDSNYTYSPTFTRRANKRTGDPSVGRGIYAENSVVALIVLSICLSVFSLLIVIQYKRPEKTGVVRLLAFLGDAVSPAYRSECRLFLLGCCVSLLAFYFVVVVAFWLPFVTGWQLDAGIQTTASPEIAAGIAVVTLLVLLIATGVMVLAFCKAPAGQRGSAPEVVTFSLFSCLLILALAVGLGMTWIENVQRSPAIGLFTHLRSFDLGGGLSPILPLSLVATGACLWALCSFRRLRLLDVLRATETEEGPHSSLSFLALSVSSFSGVRDLEENLKQTLESSSVISLPSYLLLMVLGLSAGTYFFTTRLVRALEPRPFYWVFEAAFIIVYWALLMEFLRLVFAWRSLQMLLQRLSWHPLLTAFKRYREGRPNLAKMNLSRPPSVFAALESSVTQARRLIRTAKTLATAPNLDEDLHRFFQQSLPEWDVEVQVAGSQLCEALRSEWAGESPAETRSLVDMVRRKRANRIQGDWRQSLTARARAYRALFRLLQSLEKVMEEYWSCGRAQEATVAPAPATKEFFEQVEEFTVSRVVNFLAIVFPSLQNLEYFVLAGLLLMLLAVTSYPFLPRNEFLFFNWIVILSFIGTAFWIFVQMDRDTVLSLLNDTKPGEVNVSRELVLRILLYVAVPLLTLLGAQFPESLRQILSLFTTAQASS